MYQLEELYYVGEKNKNTWNLTIFECLKKYRSVRCYVWNDKEEAVERVIIYIDTNNIFGNCYVDINLHKWKHALLIRKKQQEAMRSE